MWTVPQIVPRSFAIGLLAALSGCVRPESPPPALADDQPQYQDSAEPAPIDDALSRAAFEPATAPGLLPANAPIPLHFDKVDVTITFANDTDANIAPTSGNDGFIISGQVGPELDLKANVTHGTAPDGTEITLTIKMGGEDLPALRPVPFSSNSAEIPFSIEKIGTYQLIFNSPHESIEKTTYTLEVVPAASIEAPEFVSITENVKAEFYQHPLDENPIALHGAFTVDVTTNLADRRVAVVEGNDPAASAINTATAAGGATSLAIPIDRRALPTGRHTLMVLDTWTGATASKSAVVAVPSERSPLPPVITHFADARYGDLTSVSAGGDVSTFNRFLQLRGIDAPGNARPGRDLSFPVYTRRVPDDDISPDAAPFVRVADATIEDLRVQDGSWIATLTLPRLLDDEEGRVFAMAMSGDAHNFSSDSISFRPMNVALLNNPGNVTINSVTPQGDPNVLQVNHRVEGAAGPDVLTNAANLELNGSVLHADATQVVIVQEGKSEPLVNAEIDRSGAVDDPDSWTATLTGLQPAEYVLRAVVYQGGTEVGRSSPPARIALNSSSPVVASVEPSDFGTTPRASSLTIQFSGNPLQADRAEDESNYRLVAAIGEGIFGTEALDPKADGARYDPVRNAVTLVFDETQIRPNLYRLEIEATPTVDPDDVSANATRGLRDRFGNPLADAEGVVGRSPRFVLGQTATPAVAAVDPDSIPQGEDAPFVPYKEYTDPREIPDGFQFSDKVVTRVSRLYYYRDAHRVAEIVNRDAKSYNRLAVEARRRMAEKQRTAAQEIELDRRQQELTAIEKSKDSRAKEQRLNTAQSELGQARARVTRLRQQAGVLQNQIGAATTPLTDTDLQDLDAQIANLEAQQQAAIDRGDQPNPQLVSDLASLRTLRNRRVLSAPEAADARGQLTAVQQDLRDAEAAVTSLESSVQQLPSDVQAAREAEALAGQELQRLNILEDQAREEQFRLEVAAAHEDPDTYAPGKPESDDPVQQVSVSVIGEGEIQLRGPLKGINEIRTTINQIDAPVGQVQIGVHTVQINGERGDLMEEVVARIGVHIGQARFLTLQSAQMLRKAVVLVASRRAAAADALCGPEATQEERDVRYIDAFFGTDFVRELREIDSEFIHSSNKVLSLHSMDSTSLAAALFLLALAKNDAREEILFEFHRMADCDLPVAEMNYIQAHGRLGPDHKCTVLCHHDDGLMPLAANARFQSLTGYFDGMLVGTDTLNPIQREFIRLAQIFKARLITELQLSQRIKERAIVEERLGNRLQELRDQKAREDEANLKRRMSLDTLQVEQRNVLAAFNKVAAAISKVRSESQASQSRISQIMPQLSAITAERIRVTTQVTDRLTRNTLPWIETVLEFYVQNTQAEIPFDYIKTLSSSKQELERIADAAAKIEAEFAKPAADIFSLSYEAWEVYRDLVGSIDELAKDSTDQPLSVQFLVQSATTHISSVPIDQRATEGVIEFPTQIDDSKMGRFRFELESGKLIPIDPDSSDLMEAKLVFVAWVNEALSTRARLDQFTYDAQRQAALKRADVHLAAIKNYDRRDDLTSAGLVDLGSALSLMSEPTDHVLRVVNENQSEFGSIVAGLADSDSSIDGIYSRWSILKRSILQDLQGALLATSEQLAESVDSSFDRLIGANLEYEFARDRAEESRRPIDHKKLLDMLIDEMEDKYIELLEGTRSHTAVVDGYIKGIASALDDDFKAQFYDPAFRLIREQGRARQVQLGQIETTTILTNNRGFAKVEPQATMEFDLPKRDIVLKEAMDGAKALVDDYGALLTDPTFLSATKMLSGQPTSSLAQGTLGGGASTVRNVLPGLPRTDDEEILSQAGPGQREFGSALEALIPDPAIYKFETGTGFEIRPVIQPDGQAVVFHFNYMYTTNVREPVRPDEKHLGRVKRHFIDTDVQLSNYELREVSTYRVGLRASRTSRGVPLFEDIPIAGVLFRPLPSDESSLQQNVILSQATIFPTLFDLMGLRYAPAVADLDTLRQRNEEFTVRGRYRDLSNHVYDISTSRVDDSLRVPPAERRGDLYRTQESIPGVHPDGYRGPGLNFRDSTLQEGYEPSRLYPSTEYAPPDTQSFRQRASGPPIGFTTPVERPIGMPSIEYFEGEIIPGSPEPAIENSMPLLPGAADEPFVIDEPIYPNLRPSPGYAPGDSDPIPAPVLDGSGPSPFDVPPAHGSVSPTAETVPDHRLGSRVRRDPAISRTSATGVAPRQDPRPDAAVAARNAPGPPRPAAIAPRPASPSPATPADPRPRGLLQRLGRRGN